MSQPHRKNELCRRGQLVGGSYVVGDVLGIGGMGVVYAAVQKSLDRTVALKLPRPELVGDATVRRRLRSEALAGSRINHQNIVRVLDYGIDHALPFVVMEHIAGPRLAELLAERGPLPIPTALGLVRQIVAGLAEAHVQGVVHADVKCDNVLVETLRDGSLAPRLIDFGIARFVTDAPPPETGEPMITGTPEYLAPEVICGQVPGFTADVYAIGVMLYELVTGATPFAGGSSAEVMGRRLDDDAVPIGLRCPELYIPPAFDQLVLCALAREASARYADAGALGRALDEAARAAANVQPTPAPEPPPIFSTEATTATMSTDGLQRRGELAVGSAPYGVEDETVECLGQVRKLVDQHRLGRAIAQLEAGIGRLERRCANAPLWRLQLTLAALYDGIGERARARMEASKAQFDARRCHSATGCERAERLLSRLARRRSRTHSPPW
jgi:serine/threonine protein kinase